MRPAARGTWKFIGALAVVGFAVVLVIVGAKQLTGPVSSADTFLDAIDANDLKAVMRRVNAGQSLEVMDGTGRTPIVAAVGRPKIAGFLLEHGANPNSLLHSGDTLLVRAAQDGDTTMIDVLLDHGAKIDETTADGETALITAVVNKSSAAALELLKRGADPNERDQVGATALHYAAGRNRTDLLPALVAAHADVNSRTYVGITPLSRAILNGHAESVTYLLAHGAKPADTDYSLMHYAALTGAYPSQLEYLIAPRLEYHTSPDELRQTENSYTTNAASAQARAPLIIATLAKAGYSVNAPGKGEITPLHFAAIADNADAITTLLKLGADKSAKDAKGRTPLDLARLKKCLSAVAALDGHQTSPKTPVVAQSLGGGSHLSGLGPAGGTQPTEHGPSGFRKGRE